jgi:hypothetical protein
VAVPVLVGPLGLSDGVLGLLPAGSPALTARVRVTVKVSLGSDLRPSLHTGTWICWVLGSRGFTRVPAGGGPNVRVPVFVT